MSRIGRFHLTKSIKWQLWAHVWNPSWQRRWYCCVKERGKKRSLLSFLCVSVLFLLHPEQSAAVHKASCYPRERWLNDSLKACVSSARHAVLLKINLNVSFLPEFSISLLIQLKNFRNCTFFSLSNLRSDLWPHTCSATMQQIKTIHLTLRVSRVSEWRTTNAWMNQIL